MIKYMTLSLARQICEWKSGYRNVLTGTTE